MARKRYFYDANGRAKGYSSDESPQARNRKFFFLALPVIAVLSLCKEDKVSEQKLSSVVAEEISNEEQSAKKSIEDSYPQDFAPVDAKKEIPSVIKEDEKVVPVKIKNTEEYMQETYVNSNPKCPKDIQEYHVRECAKGDESSCISARRCDP